MPTPLHAIRIPDELWDAALARTRADGRTVTDVVIEALRAYVALMPSPPHGRHIRR
jgi:hypothetical protein